MRIGVLMAVARVKHPVRLALVCAMLALAGSAPMARGGYAEVATASAVTRPGAPAALATAPAPAADAVGFPPAPARLPLVAAAGTPRPVGALYLVHCALLL